jgi:transposase
MRIEGALTTEVFELYVPHLLVPCLRPGHRVLLANVKFHSAPQALELIAAAGAQVGHLPAYSPDFNPIEGCIAKLQTAGRSFKARTTRKLAHALAKALTWITQQDLHGGFEPAGSVSSLK